MAAERGVKFVMNAGGLNPHGAREADDLRRPLAFHGEANQQSGDVRGRSASFHDLGHRGGRLVGRQIFVPRQFLD